VMGLLSTVLNVDWRSRLDSSLAALVLTGLLGGYTTFSSYQLDTVTLSNKKAQTLAAVYWAGSVAAGLAAAALGAAVAGMVA
jgi:fluoride exporter